LTSPASSTSATPSCLFHPQHILRFFSPFPLRGPVEDGQVL
jgi:hypothetical protein